MLTHRPEFQNRWADHGHVSALNLSKLTRAQSSAMVAKIADGRALPPDLFEQILVKTDGVPLFVEELTKSILESGELTERRIVTHTPAAAIMSPFQPRSETL